MKWRRIARLVIAIVAVAFAVGVGMTMKRRQTPQTQPPVPRADPEAVLESEGGNTVRIKGDREDFNLSYERLLTYANGATKMIGVTIVTDRGGRTYTVKGGEGQAGENESTMELSGGVRLEATDGMVVTADRATFSQVEGIVRIPGSVQFARDRMSGSGFGFDYDQKQDIVTIGDRAAITVKADRTGTGAMTLAAGGLEFRRTEKIIRLDRGTTITRDRETVEADQALAHLSPDEQRLELLELRGRSRITSAARAPGGLEALRGREIDLRYGPDGQALERAVINGDADLQLAGEVRQAGRRIMASAMNIDLGPDGSTPTALVARDNVRVTLPGEAAGTSRTIAAQALDSTGDGTRGLTGAHFTGNIQFTEQRPGGGRSARSQVLDVTMGPGFGAIEDATFTRGVRFADGDLFATAAAGRYAINRGVLELSGSEPGSLSPHVVDEQLTVDASRIDITLEGPVMNAAGAVKSVLTPKKTGQGNGASETRLPSMLKGDQPVNITANELAYDGTAERAVYSGSALLWQNETSIKGSAITINNKTGDLAAAGPVTTSTMLLQEDKQGAKQKVSSIGSSKEFAYVDSLRRATYTGDVHITGPQGDLTSPKVELFLEPSGDELDRAEAYDGVTLRGDGRKTTGVRLTFFGADQRYVVIGAPVTVIDECGRETTGRTLTFFRATDRIVVDGNEQIRTQTRGKSNCS